MDAFAGAAGAVDVGVGLDVTLVPGVAAAVGAVDGSAAASAGAVLVVGVADGDGAAAAADGPIRTLARAVLTAAVIASRDRPFLR
ncbi:hypothetical protein A6A27_38815 [Micromonospora sp. CB01531]|nr:hypothetical protein A6A27_38815 [Micromonospora sp. CB01531]